MPKWEMHDRAHLSFDVRHFEVRKITVRNVIISKIATYFYHKKLFGILKLGPNMEGIYEKKNIDGKNNILLKF